MTIDCVICTNSLAKLIALLRCSQITDNHLSKKYLRCYFNCQTFYYIARCVGIPELLRQNRCNQIQEPCNKSCVREAYYIDSLLCCPQRSWFGDFKALFCFFFCLYIASSKISIHAFTSVLLINQIYYLWCTEHFHFMKLNTNFIQNI